MSVVRLSVHRNNIDARRRKRLRRHLKEDVNSILRDLDIGGYVVIAWDQTKGTKSRWSCKEGPISSNTLAEHMKTTIIRDMGRMDASDVINERFDFEPDERA